MCNHAETDRSDRPTDRNVRGTDRNAHEGTAAARTRRRRACVGSEHAPTTAGCGRNEATASVEEGAGDVAIGRAVAAIGRPGYSSPSSGTALGSLR